MFNVMISFGPSGNQWLFMFEKKESALKIRTDHTQAKLHDKMLVIVDDYGNEAEIMPHSIYGILIEDLTKVGDAAIERSLYQARAQAKGQNKAQNDPLLKLSAPMMQMPGMNGPQRRPF